MADGTTICGVYGAPPADLALADAAAVQFSPTVPGGEALEGLHPGALTQMVMSAPPGTIERRYAVALSLKALRPGAPLTVLAPKDKGGSRLRKELEAFGCVVQEDARRHHRICLVERPESPVGLEAAVAEGAPRLVKDLGLWSQPGVFSWDRIDPGSALLAKNLPPLAGEGADLGCGLGLLTHAVLQGPKVQRLEMIDNDRRAIAVARRNVDDRRVVFNWADVTGPDVALEGLDFVVMNPPFHDGGSEDRGLGQRFIRCAHRILRAKGTLWLVANRHLPYEPILAQLFTTAERRVDSGGYKVFEARK